MIRVLLAEDMRILRDTLVSVLNLEDDIKVVAQVRSAPTSCLRRWRSVPLCWTSTCRAPDRHRTRQQLVRLHPRDHR